MLSKPSESHALRVLQALLCDSIAACCAGNRVTKNRPEFHTAPHHPRGRWVLDHFHPMGDIPTAVKLTSYSGEATDLTPTQLQDYIGLVETGELEVKTGPIFDFEELVEAHKLMDANQAGGKIVVRGRK